MKQCEFDRWVAYVRSYKDQYESMLGGYSTAHRRSYKCYRLLRLYDDKSDLEKLLEEAISLPISYDALCLLSRRYLRYVSNTEEWPESLRTWLGEQLNVKIKGPKRPQKKRQQPDENTPDLGRWEAGRDFVIGWLMGHLVGCGIKPTDAIKVVAAGYLMSPSNVRKIYYKFKAKYAGKTRAQIPNPFVFIFSE